MLSVKGLAAFILLALSVKASDSDSDIEVPVYVLLSCWTKCLLFKLSMYLVTSKANFSWSQVLLARILHLKSIHAILMTTNVYRQILDSYVEQRRSACHCRKLQWWRRSKMEHFKWESSNVWKQMLGRTRRQESKRRKPSGMDMFSEQSQPVFCVYSKLQLLMRSMQFIKSRRKLNIWLRRGWCALEFLVKVKEIALP